MAYWANPEKIGIIITSGDVLRYVDCGPEYDAAVAASPADYVGPIVDIITAADIAANLATWRASAKCTRMQGILALGENRWAKVLACRATATWAEQIVIDDAGNWHRTSQNIQFFGYLLNLSDAEIDALFQTAAQIVA